MPDLPDLRRRIEAAKSEPDPTARDAALSQLEAEIPAGDQEAEDLRGIVRTYRGDARLQLEGASGG